MKKIESRVEWRDKSGTEEEEEEEEEDCGLQVLQNEKRSIDVRKTRKMVHYG